MKREHMLMGEQISTVTLPQINNGNHAISATVTRSTGGTTTILRTATVEH
jgi:hypothetical protein